MALSEKMLMAGEENLQTTRTHVKVLWWNFVVLLVVCFVTAFAVAKIGGRGDGIPRWIVLGVAAVVLVWFVVLPFLRWYLWTYTLTNKRLVEQKGILTRTGRVMPLSRINDVSYEKNLNDRILRCGTLIIHNAAEAEALHLHDIPQIESFHRAISDLVFEAHPTDDESI